MLLEAAEYKKTSDAELQEWVENAAGWMTEIQLARNQAVQFEEK
jgi:hypothetical protein